MTPHDEHRRCLDGERHVDGDLLEIILDEYGRVPLDQDWREGRVPRKMVFGAQLTRLSPDRVA
jgi:hypothetical protein